MIPSFLAEGESDERVPSPWVNWFHRSVPVWGALSRKGYSQCPFRSFWPFLQLPVVNPPLPFLEIYPQKNSHLSPFLVYGLVVSYLRHNPLARKLINKTVLPQLNNSEDFAIASEKRNKWIQNNHLGLSHRESLWVCVTTRYRGSFCLQARLDPAFGSLRSAFSLQLPLCPLPACLPYSSSPPVSLVGWDHHSWRKEVLW